MKKLTYSLIIMIGLFLTACGGNNSTGPNNNKKPQVDFSHSKAPIVGEEVTFTGKEKSSSSDIKSWKWNFGDANSSTASGKEVTFTYKKAGDYEVVLTATDVNGKSAKVKHFINVMKQGQANFTIAWSFSTGNSVQRPNIASAPAIADDGTIYYTENNNDKNSSIIAVTDQGDNAKLKWKVSIGSNMKQAPAIGPDGGIYIGDADSEFVKITKGDISWRKNVHGSVRNATAAIDDDGNVYIVTKGAGHQGGVISFAPDGTRRWAFYDVASMFESPAISKDGKTIFGLVTRKNKAYMQVFNTDDGSRKWSKKVVKNGYAGGTSISIGQDGTIYVTASNEVVAVTPGAAGVKGSIKWTQSVSHANLSGVVIGPSGSLYVGSKDGLVALNPDDGSIKWTYDQINASQNVPAVDNNGNIYVGTLNGKFEIISPSGQLLQEFSLGNSSVNSPVIADDGSVYVEAYDNSKIKLYKITGKDNDGPADSNWPMKGKNRKHTSS